MILSVEENMMGVCVLMVRCVCVCDYHVVVMYVYMYRLTTHNYLVTTVSTCNNL